MKGKINENDKQCYRIITMDGAKLYIKIWFSDNPPASNDNPGCIGIQLYDSHMKEIDGGELDYESEDVKLEDMINDCIDFMEIKAIEVKPTKMLKLINY